MKAASNQQISELARRWAPWLLAMGLIAFALLMFHKVLAPGACLFSTDNNIGSTNLSKDTLPGDFLGAWSDSTFLGLPIGFASFTWLSILTWLLPLNMYIDWIHAIDLVIASLFIALFLRRQKIGLPAIAMGVLTAFWLGSNLTLTYAGHTGKYGVLMLASVALYCISRALSRPQDLLWGILAGGAIGFMFIEQLDVALFFGLALGAYALFLAIRQWRASRTFGQSVVVLVLMGAIGLLLSAPTMFNSYKSNVQDAAGAQQESPAAKWDFTTQWSWPPEECIDFIAPGYMGWRSGEEAGPYWGRMGRSSGWEQTKQGFMNFKLENMYLGIIPVLLALFAVLWSVMRRKMKCEPRMDTDGHGSEMGSGVAAVRGSAKTAEVLQAKNYPRNTLNDTEDAIGSHGSSAGTVRRPSSVVCRPFAAERRAEILFWACVAVITLLLAFGKFFPLYALFYKLPLVSSIRNPNKFLQVFQLALGLLAAYGLDEMLCGKRAERGLSTEKGP